MYGRRYLIPTGFQTVGTSAQDLLEITLPSDLVVVLHGLIITVSGAPDLDSAQLIVKRGAGATSGSGGGTPSSYPLNFGDVACSCTLERNNTTQATAGGGSLDSIFPTTIQVVGGEQLVLPPEIRPIFSPSQLIVVSIGALTAAVTMNCTAIIEEIGG